MKSRFLLWLSRKGINFFISNVIIVIIAGALFTFYSRYVIDQQKLRSEHAQEVILELQQLSSFVMLADVGVRGYMLVQEDRFISPYHYAKETYPKTLESITNTLALQQYPELDSMKAVESDINAYMEVLDKMFGHSKNGDTLQAQALLYQDLGKELMNNYNKQSAKVKQYEQQVLISANEQANHYIDIIGYIQWLLLVLGLPTLSIVIYRIKKNESSRKALFQRLEESNKKYIFNPGTDDVLDEENIIESIIKNLRQASEFIKKITSGDYSVRWIGMTETNSALNQENLAGELIQMREQMKKVKEEDNRRLWATEGLSMIAEITRKYQNDTDELGDQLVSHIVQYLEANQAGLFVINDDDDSNKLLELKACYAYDRKKYLQRVITPGEGLVGQAYLEADTVYLTEVPQEYIRITSGLGKATPRSILIVPLIYNEKVMGVLEIAAFKAFEKYQINFVESLGEIIASSISTVKTNEKTHILLEQSQEQAEEMRAQEEEMRQNMEELQATQEEMQRKTQEYEELINQYQQKYDNVDKD